jgi:hypothetical protein
MIMSVRIFFNKYKDDQGMLKADPENTELTSIQSLDMSWGVNGSLTGCEPDVLVIQIKRDASHGTVEDLLASEKQFGEKKKGDKWDFAGAVVLIDDTKGPTSIMGQFDLEKAQVMFTQGGSSDIESVTIHARQWKYTNVEGGNKLVSEKKELVPIKATGCA